MCLPGPRPRVRFRGPPDARVREPSSFVVTDSTGKEVPDLFRVPYLVPGGGSIPMGRRWVRCSRVVDLNRFAWFAEPGVQRG